MQVVLVNSYWFVDKCVFVENTCVLVHVREKYVANMFTLLLRNLEHFFGAPFFGRSKCSRAYFYETSWIYQCYNFHLQVQLD